MCNKIDVLNKSLRKLAKEEEILIVDNSNIDTACLSARQLHLNRKGVSTLARNFINFLDNIWIQHAIPDNVLPNYDQNSEHESIIGVDTSNGTSGYIESQYVVNMEANTDCFEEMKMLRLNTPKKL